MKNITFFAAIMLLLSSCGTQQQAVVGNDNDEELINMGYTRIRKAENTTAASQIDISKRPETYDNIYDYLRGKVSGLYVGPITHPGEAPEMRIRGTNSINSDNNPLILVDGSEMSNITGLDPYMVSYVSVLKGPEAAIYGARGANGVILITTKSK